MALDEFGMPKRKLEPDLFKTRQSRLEVPSDVWITPELKAASKTLLKLWDFGHEEQLTDLNIRDVHLKFTTVEGRAAFLKALELMAGDVNPNFPRTYPLPKAAQLPSAGVETGVWINFWFKYFLPDMFDEVVQDIAGTEQHTVRVQPQILHQTKAFLEACKIGWVRMNLVAEEGANRSVVESLTESLREAHSMLRRFLDLLVRSLPDPKVHRIIILAGDQFQLDGEPKEFTGAALRALLAMALLCGQTEFELEDFARHYHGGRVDDPKTDFDNAMKALKKVLPNLEVKTPSKNHRGVSGIKFLLEVDENLISRRLASLHSNR